MKQNKNIVLTVTAIALTGALLSGCSQQEVQLANTAVNAAATSNASTNTLKTLASPAGVGMAQSQVIGAQMLANPSVLGVSALATGLSEQKMAKNKQSFGALSSMMGNADVVNNGMEGRMVKAYNQQYGTHYSTMQQLQEAVKIQGYNEKYGTKYTTLTQLREDYNKRNGTNYKTDKEFRAWMAQER